MELQYFAHRTVIFDGVEAEIFMVTDVGMGVKILKSDKAEWVEQGEYFIPHSAGIVFRIMPQVDTSRHSWGISSAHNK